MPNKNYLVLIIIIIALIVAGFLVFSKDKSDNTGANTGQSPLTSSSDVETGNNSSLVADEQVVVTYNESSFSPDPIEIKQGTTVVFENHGSGSMWPASDSHPTHRDYPVTGGCAGSAFDSCGGIAGGESWSFTFDKVGAWKYHDHLRPQATSTIIVK